MKSIKLKIATLIVSILCYSGVYPSPLSEHFLTKDIIDQLEHKKTKNGVTLEKIIKACKKNPNSKIGAFAGDEESYKIFSPLFSKLVSEYHKSDKHKNEDWSFNNDSQHIIMDPEKKYVLSCRVRVSRNVSGYPFASTIALDQRLELEKQIVNGLQTLPEEFSGAYYSIENLTTEEFKKLVDNHLLFSKGGKSLESAGINSDWPCGRGIYIAKSKNFLVWVNEEDHLRIISMEDGADILNVFVRLRKAVSCLSKVFKFSHNKKFGYLASCPTNVGTGMRASVHIRLPHLSKNKKLKELCNNLDLDIRGIDGENSESRDNIYDISNIKRLGISEIEIINLLCVGVNYLIKEEKKLEKQHVPK